MMTLPSNRRRCTICAYHLDWASAKYWAMKMYYESRVAGFGVDSYKEREVKAMMLDPKTSLSASGMGTHRLGCSPACACSLLCCAVRPVPSNKEFYILFCKKKKNRGLVCATQSDGPQDQVKVNNR
jgi:hypothetical protein